MDLEQIKKFLEENKDKEDVKAYLNRLSTVSSDKVSRFLDTEEGKRLIQPKLDSHFTKGLETWKTNNLDSLVEAKEKELYPEETEEQKRIRKLEKELEDQRNESKREKLMNKAVSYASEKSLPADIVGFFLGDDEESTIKNLGTLEEKYTAAVKNAVNEKFKNGGRDIQVGASADDSLGASFAKTANQQKEINEKSIWD
ncbi:DUF4355 domain-containing protein [Rossellomorea sp. BNER]|uniref:DUF4355 domain-containing protein n=1 Tax=Rossellomorea sp. BNER TaxID=2962031 RepID=UPI003AF304C3|nr:DUF4355 domain-containing protein [Rossellomorea sp. BNER]